MSNITFKGYVVTDEQQACIDAVTSNEDTKIQAPAGSGKTFTLEASAHFHDTDGLYVAFIKAIADEAGRRFPSNIECRTGHSLAFRQEGRKYVKRLGKLTGAMINNAFDIGDSKHFNTPVNKGYKILDTIRKFCYSADDKISSKHTPKLAIAVDDKEMAKIEKDLAQHARIVWEEMIDVDSTLPVTHDTYLKVWALSDPDLRKETIYFDEAQDANPVILKVMNDQDAQKVFVGDKFQQIYGWRGALNAMESIDTEHEVYITQSFRFGQDIADMANNILHSYMEPWRRPPLIKGFKGQESCVLYRSPEETPNAIICRTNSGVISNVFTTLAHGHRVYVQGGVNSIISMLKGAEDLQNGKRTNNPELSLFKDWSEVVEYSETDSGTDIKAFLSLIKEYGISSLINTLKGTCNSARFADITLTTAHKSKGLEWDHVKLHNDFFTPMKGKRLPQGEINILYVAATRALHTLDVSNCPACSYEVLRENFLLG